MRAAARCARKMLIAKTSGVIPCWRADSLKVGLQVGTEF